LVTRQGIQLIGHLVDECLVEVDSYMQAGNLYRSTIQFNLGKQSEPIIIKEIEQIKFS